MVTLRPLTKGTKKLTYKLSMVLENSNPPRNWGHEPGFVLKSGFFIKDNSLVTSKSVGTGLLLFLNALFPAMAIFLKGISIGLKGGG
jgi:hypothetical protein